MSLRRTIFEHDPEPRHFWVQARVLIPGPRIKTMSLRLTEVWNDEGRVRGAYEITDFRAPAHPEIDWDWIHAHSREVWAAVEFDS